MQTASARRSPDDPRAETRLVLHGIGWDQYEAILAALGDSPGVRLAYLEGELEIMSPSDLHELLKKGVARMLEIYAVARDLPLVGYGSTTFRRKAKKRGFEPDECYVLSENPARPVVPDLAIEVVLSHWEIDKLSLYAGLGIQELWLLRAGQLEILVKRGAGYRKARRSRLFPELDLAELMRFAARPDQTRAAREYLTLLQRS